MSDDNDDFFDNFSTAPQDIAINPANVHYTNFLDDDNNTASASSKPIKVNDNTIKIFALLVVAAQLALGLYLWFVILP